MKIKIKKYSLYSVNLAFASILLCTVARASITPAFKENIDNKINALFPTAHVGLAIKNLETNQIIYANQSDKFFTPASTLKLFTSYAALTYLKQNYTFDTTLKFDPKKITAQGILNSDVVLTFSGDPSFTDHTLTDLLTHLSNQGIHKINGKIIVENRGFILPYESPGATWDTWSYYPPVSSIIVNENTALVKITPGATLNSPSSARLAHYNDSTDLPPVTLTHSIKTVSAEEAEQSCSLEVAVSKNNAITLFGCWPINKLNSTLTISLVSPEKALEKKIFALLKKQNIQHKDQFIYFTNEHTVKLNPGLETIATISSAPLHELIKPLLEDSNNLYADSVHKKLGEKYFGVGSYAYGVKAQQTILGKLAIPMALNQQFDGSGASRYNLVSPNQLLTLLSQLYEDNYAYEMIINALPVAGVSGTLKNRFKINNTTICQNKIWAKTGTLKNISGLAGYLNVDSGKQYAFALMIQGEGLQMKKIKAKEDELLAEIFAQLQYKMQRSFFLGAAFSSGDPALISSG